MLRRLTNCRLLLLLLLLSKNGGDVVGLNQIFSKFLENKAGYWRGNFV